MLLGLGLQHKTVDELSKELDLPGTQLLGLFNRTIKKVLDYVNGILQNALVGTVSTSNGNEKTLKMVPVAESLEEEFSKAEKELRHKQEEELELLRKNDLSQYAIKGSEAEWSKALTAKSTASISVKVGEKRLIDDCRDSKVSGKKGKASDGDFGKGWKKKKSGNNSLKKHKH